MANNDFLSTVAVAIILVTVAMLVVLSALTLVPINLFGRRYVMAFWVCLLATWAWSVFLIVVLQHRISA
jgi:hypothetical protein